ncbi:hypothetical protein J4710_09240 [Staphylococcus xylosus]|uniref:Phosphoribosylaminoimidazole carboxylase C-terminal domain-containing protein n=1 Tax=Staphylococcus xylosus TaxID=1288 RepID=A0A939SMD6_STAXY|nr:hypothetical protein [Staphylococcus xylosus]
MIMLSGMHIYGKHLENQNKMGHLTVLTTDINR